MLQDISSQVGEHWLAEGSLAANAGSVAAGPDQQGHTELNKKRIRTRVQKGGGESHHNLQ
jgi:hypothetical protein